MHKYTQEELDNVLVLHIRWWGGNAKGARADLSYADLSGLNLSNANLTYANLFNANLSEANLSRANLSEAILFKANLSCSDLSCADLSEAYLTYANLYKANLCDADLSDANLSEANLQGVVGARYIMLQGNRHGLQYNIDTQELRIGCQVHSLQHWLEHGLEIAKEHEYSEADIKAYSKLINTLGEYK